jgi:hypothetical protein
MFSSCSCSGSGPGFRNRIQVHSHYIQIQSVTGITTLPSSFGMGPDLNWIQNRILSKFLARDPAKNPDPIESGFPT